MSQLVTLVFKNNLSKHEVMIPKGARLIDAVEEAGFPVPFGCGQGVCGSCLIRVENGELSAPDESEKVFLAELGADCGNRLACQILLESDLEFSI